MTIQNFPSGTCRGAPPGGLETGLRTAPKSLILKDFLFFVPWGCTLLAPRYNIPIFIEMRARHGQKAEGEVGTDLA